MKALNYSITLSLILFTFIPAASFGEDSPLLDNTRYISESLIIKIKDKLEKPNSAVGIVRSGDKVFFLVKSDNYYTIRTAEGAEGWLPKQYVMTKLPQMLITKKLKAEIKALREQIALLESNQSLDNRSESSGTEKETTPPENSKRLIELETKLGEAKETIAELLQEKEETTLPPSELTINQAVLEMQKQKDEALEKADNLAKSYDTLLLQYKSNKQKLVSLENAPPQGVNYDNFYWFGAGAFVFFAGLLSGKMRSRKKNKLSF